VEPATEEPRLLLGDLLQTASMVLCSNRNQPSVACKFLRTRAKITCTVK